MEKLIDLNVKGAIAALKSGKVSSRELTEAFLARIAGDEAKVHAFITTTPDLALEMADAADTKRVKLKKESSVIPPLLGLPIAIKDVLCVDGVRATCGSKILEHFRPPFNATAVEKLLRRSFRVPS